MLVNYELCGDNFVVSLFILLVFIGFALTVLGLLCEDNITSSLVLR